MIYRSDIAGRIRMMGGFGITEVFIYAATPDYEGFGERLGHRVVSIGERPFLDVESKSRLEALRQ